MSDKNARKIATTAKPNGLSTGRASYDMVAKGVRLGIPILASISSPTSLAVELADALNCTLVGYLRGKALNLYTHGWRILPPARDCPTATPHCWCPPCHMHGAAADRWPHHGGFVRERIS